MKQMQRDPNASDKARRAEKKADEKSGLITIKPLKLESSSGKGGFKKGGFKSAFGSTAGSIDEAKEKPGFKKVLGVSESALAPAAAPSLEEESDDEIHGYEYYDPRKPTGCNGNCGATNS